MTQVGAKALTHDANGNVTAFGTRSFTYNAENQLLTGPGTTLSYDPAMRLYQTVAGTATVRMAYDGLDRIVEYDGADIIQRRYVHGPGMDQPLVWYEGTGTTDRRFLSSDERGSIISVTDSTGALLRINKYDEYGNPQGTNLGVWGYTGQAWLPGMGGWYYKNRVYDRELGRFLQADPIGYEGGPNMYAYVRNDPVNLIDPLGLHWVTWCATAVSESGDFTRSCFQRWVAPDPVSPRDWSTVADNGRITPPSKGVVVGLASRPPVAKATPNCPTTESTWGHVAREAGEISDATAGIAAVTGVLGLATSETIVGGLTFGGISLGSGAISLLASGIQAGAEYMDRNARAATSHALGTSVGWGSATAISAATKSFGGPATRFGSAILGEIAGRTTTALACGD